MSKLEIFQCTLFILMVLSIWMYYKEGGKRYAGCDTKYTDRSTLPASEYSRVLLDQDEERVEPDEEDSTGIIRESGPAEDSGDADLFRDR